MKFYKKNPKKKNLTSYTIQCCCEWKRYQASRARLLSFSTRTRKNEEKKTYNGGKFHATFCSQERKRTLETRGFVYAFDFSCENLANL